MPKCKSPLIRTMRSIATTPRAYDDIPALVALASCLHLFHKDNEANCSDFIKIICNPSHFHLSYENLAPLCYHSEKTVRNKCNSYIRLFYAEYSYFKKLPLPLLIARLTEYLSDSFLRDNIPSLNAISANDIIAVILSYNATQRDKQLSLSILAEVEELPEQNIKGVL